VLVLGARCSIRAPGEANRHANLEPRPRTIANPNLDLNANPNLNGEREN
jgi:hypothetical protein